jgi:hypothetical protein
MSRQFSHIKLQSSIPGSAAAGQHADGREDSVRTTTSVRYMDIHRDSPDIQMPETGIAHFYKIMVLQLERCNAR